jgi:hypothetical protein
MIAIGTEDLCAYFDQCGVPDDITLRTLRRLYKRGLIETLDPNAEDVGPSDRIAIKESGNAHLDLIISSTVYLEQMALVTGLSEVQVRDEIKRLVVHPNAQKFIEIRDIFIRYLLKMDAARLVIPSSRSYSSLNEARRLFRERPSEDRPQTNKGYTGSKNKRNNRSKR